MMCSLRFMRRLPARESRWRSWAPEEASTRRIRLHDVRHTYATASLEAGINPKIVSERIGRSSLAFTLQVYTHSSEGRDRDAAQMIATLIVPKELTHQADEAESRPPR